MAHAATQLECPSRVWTHLHGHGYLDKLTDLMTNQLLHCKTQDRSELIGHLQRTIALALAEQLAELQFLT